MEPYRFKPLPETIWAAAVIIVTALGVVMAAQNPAAIGDPRTLVVAVAAATVRLVGPLLWNLLASTQRSEESP